MKHIYALPIIALVACATRTEPLPAVLQADVCMGQTGCTSGGNSVPSPTFQTSYVRFVSSATSLVLSENAGDSNAYWELPRAPAPTDGQQMNIQNRLTGIVGQASLVQSLRPTGDTAKCLGVGPQVGSNTYAAQWTSASCAPLHLYGPGFGGSLWAGAPGSGPAYRLDAGNPGDLAHTAAVWVATQPSNLPTFNYSVIPLGARVNFWPSEQPSTFVTYRGPGVSVDLENTGPIVAQTRQPTSGAQDWYGVMVGQRSNGGPLIVWYSALTAVPRSFSASTNVLDGVNGAYMSGPQNTSSVAGFFDFFSGNVGVGFVDSASSCMTFANGTIVPINPCTLDVSEVFDLQVRM